MATVAPATCGPSSPAGRPLRAANADVSTGLVTAPIDQDWDAWSRLLTDDATYRDHYWGTFHGPAEIARFLNGTMAFAPDVYTVLARYVVDGVVQIAHGTLLPTRRLLRLAGDTALTGVYIDTAAPDPPPGVKLPTSPAGQPVASPTSATSACSAPSPSVYDTGTADWTVRMIAGVPHWVNDFCAYEDRWKCLETRCSVEPAAFLGTSSNDAVRPA